MIDLHTHVLPGIDDGAEHFAEAVEMCRRAIRDGCTALVATPHQRRGSWWNDDLELLEALRARIEREVADELRLYPGGEIHVDGRFLDDFLDAPGSACGVLPLAGSRYLLLELDVDGAPIEAFDLIHELVVTGWRPILAHPELIPWLAGEPDLIARLVGLGAATQVTAMSLTGEFGRRPQADVHRLLEAGLVHFVASDCHGIAKRPPGLARARRLVAARFGEEIADRLFVENPRAVIEDRTLPGLSPAGRLDSVLPQGLP
ncbi:MAG TPA: CpsB/CapC family capsule biosynthesis tyrosine phosphatase [Thermoanaerobaculia bacterium]|nr:CpsB/CapC family capsule biosynthesis tyrosine phosphatase [Thermoanaerobaculia bacterium]